MENTLFNQVFRDNEGKIVLAQMPNLPLIVWIVANYFRRALGLLVLVGLITSKIQ